MRNWYSICCAIVWLSSQGQVQPDVTVKRALTLMGTAFEISVVAPSEEIGYINVDEAVSEIKRIENIISSWNPDSETSKINAKAGIAPVPVSSELFDLITRAKTISEITDGAFDISYAAMDRLWKFDGSMTAVPSAEALRQALYKVGYQNIILDSSTKTVFLKRRGMRIGFGAIGKGYAADKVKKLLISKGVVGGLINASGDLTAWGTKANGEPWKVGIIDPFQKQEVLGWMPIVEASVATSGNYEKYVKLEGKQYSHIIDPRTGYPTEGVNSVSIFAQKAELCDALATAVFILGRDSGLHLINQLDGVEVVLIDNSGKMHKSSGIFLEIEQNK
ncbi:MAG: FAD:protein FMN transferase [Bacteroidota bacterium]